MVLYQTLGVQKNWLRRYEITPFSDFNGDHVLAQCDASVDDLWYGTDGRKSGTSSHHLSRSSLGNGKSRYTEPLRHHAMEAFDIS